MRADDGKFAVGWLIALLILAGAAYGAYWFLGEYGFIDKAGTETEGGLQDDASSAGGADSGDSRPGWLEGTDYEMPPLIESDGERPDLYELPDWIWEVDDDSWDLTVIREGDGDGEDALAERQSLVLVSPTGEFFLVTDELRNDYRFSVVQWDATHNVAWMRRGGRPGLEAVTELDLISGESNNGWGGGAIPATNRVDGDVVNVDVVGEQADGLELWEAYDIDGYVTGVMWRDGADFVGSLMTNRISRMVSQGFSTGDGVQAWIDLSGMRAVYHGYYVNSSSDEAEEDQWFTHDLSDDSFAQAWLYTPTLDCRPTDAVRKGTFEGDRVVATCDGDEYLLDPYNRETAQSR
ncbi:hypothetical protein [Demequina sediminicola]|uniref:hypothetical protein n=1 Tax=Demequina sediminicola TaxID=1095026 RepID=UPI000784E3D8|nr:hypothetical protein [Demequina sediminicola]